MGTNPNFNNEPEILKRKTKEDEFKNLKYQIDKHDHEKKLKSLEMILNFIRKNIEV